VKDEIEFLAKTDDDAVPQSLNAYDGSPDDRVNRRFDGTQDEKAR